VKSTGAHMPLTQHPSAQPAAAQASG